MTRARDAKIKPSIDSDGDGTLDRSADLNGDGIPEDDFDFNNNGRIDADELARAYYDQNGDGMADRGKTAFRFSDEDMQRAYAIWNSLKDDRPDRTLVA
jgi:hypothetical protein